MTTKKSAVAEVQDPAGAYWNLTSGTFRPARESLVDLSTVALALRDLSSGKHSVPTLPNYSLGSTEPQDNPETLGVLRSWVHYRSPEGGYQRLALHIGAVWVVFGADWTSFAATVHPYPAAESVHFWQTGYLVRIIDERYPPPLTLPGTKHGVAMQPVSIRSAQMHVPTISRSTFMPKMRQASELVHMCEMRVVNAQKPFALITTPNSHIRTDKDNYDVDKFEFFPQRLE